MNSPPDHSYIPNTCSPPPPDENYYYWPGGNNPHGVYLPPGYYRIDPGLITDGSDSERDIFSDPDPAYAPPLPPWIPPVCDPDANGNYFWGGGYMPSGKYMGEGWYSVVEFYG